MTAPVRVLLFSTLYPSAARPLHGLFVETRLRELLKSGEVEARVIAPVPWFPLRGRVFGEYGAFAATPRRELRAGIEVHYPRYLAIPKMGMNSAPDMIARAALPVARRLIAQGHDFDLIDAHYYYPDGVAAGLVARSLGKPFIVTARGTDLNVLPDFPLPRKRILETAGLASASIGVSRSLMDRLVELGADPAKLHVLRNGVDLERFMPAPRQEARARLGLPESGTMLLSVGRLIEGKGHHIAIDALSSLTRDTSLVIVGNGEQRQALEARARKAGVDARVRFAGGVPQEELRWYYSAADALLLCSAREGWANVLLEAMACGTPVISTDIAGTREVVTSPAAGRLMRERSAAGLVEGHAALFGDYPKREATRAFAESFSWQATTEGQIRVMRAAIEASGLPGAAGAGKHLPQANVAVCEA